MSDVQNDKNIFYETLEWICGKLEAQNISYMITGGSAVGFWGQIRTTMDIDIVIRIYVKDVDNFLNTVKKEAYVDIEEAKKSVLEKKMFNIIHNKMCFKIDIIPLDENNEYEVEKFNNKIKITLKNREIFVIAPEDLIISKLLWSKISGGSERQIKDCESIYKLNIDDLDLKYIEKWAATLKIKEDFNVIKRGG